MCYSLYAKKILLGVSQAPDFSVSCFATLFCLRIVNMNMLRFAVPTLRYGRIQQIRPTVIKLPSMRSFCSAGDSADWKKVRIDAITQLGAQLNFKEEDYEQYPVIEGMIRHLMSKYAQKRMIPKDFVHTLLDASTFLHKQLPNIIEVNRLVVELADTEENSEGPGMEFGSRLSIVGDLHGQYDDLAMLFDEPLLADYPSPYNQFVFNGDMVNRGPMSVETIVTILFCNLLLPNAVHVLRGNHETKMCIHQFGFKAEILRKYDVEILNKFTDLFDALPVGAVVENDYFVVHGGLGNVSGESTIAELNQLNRFEELKQESVIMELLWSDPLDNITGHEKNTVRGGSVTTFGPDITEAFLTRNNLQAIIRSHEFVEEGVEMCHGARVWTVFSAPNYADGANLGAIIRFEGKTDNFPSMVQYSSAAMKRIADAEKARKDSTTV